MVTVEAREVILGETDNTCSARKPEILGVGPETVYSSLHAPKGLGDVCCEMDASAFTRRLIRHEYNSPEPSSMSFHRGTTSAKQ